MLFEIFLNQPKLVPILPILQASTRPSHNTYETFNNRYAIIGVIVRWLRQGGGLSGLYPVKGKITSNRTPLPGVTITVTPVNATPDMRRAVAQSGADGTFALTTLKPQDGVYPGEYKVAISKTAASITPEQQKELLQAGARDPVTIVVNLMPKKYQRPDTSDLTLTVKAGRNPEWEIDIPEGLETPVFPPHSLFEAHNEKTAKGRVRNKDAERQVISGKW